MFNDSFDESNKESENTIYFFIFFVVCMHAQNQILNYLIKQKDIDSENYTIYENFYNKQANEIKEQNNLLMHLTSV